jgi:hypothetical protein
MTERGWRYEFVVRPPMAFIANWRATPFVKRKAYSEWCKMVREVAAYAGGLKLPLAATKTEPAVIVTRSWFRDGRHPDPENVRKAIADALMYQGRTGKGLRDKFCGGAFGAPLYDEADPRVEVMVADGRLCLRDIIPEGW